MSEKFKEENPEKEQAFNAAIKLRDSGDFVSACDKLSLLIEKYPDFGEAYLIKGGIYQDLKQFDEAIKCFKKATQLNNKSEIASLGLFHSLWEKGDWYNALEEMKRFISCGGKSKDYDEIIDEISEKIKSKD